MRINNCIMGLKNENKGKRNMQNWRKNIYVILNEKWKR